MKNLFYFILLVFLIGCNKPQKNTEKTAKVVENQVNSDSLTIDLVILKEKGFLKNTEVISIKNDPVYHKTKKFNAILLKSLLEKFSSVKRLDASQMKIVFECVDGYKPEMPLDKFLASKAYLALSDVDAPAGKEWQTIMKDNHEMTAEPFYVVYADSPADNDYKWPYNLIKIHFEPAAENESFIKPHDETALKGFELFKKNCQTCHAVNKVGGKMGPELNYPKNVTEYWKTGELKGFIKNPNNYRNEVKMPVLNLSDSEIDEILKYLSVMAKQKL